MKTAFFSICVIAVALPGLYPSCVSGASFQEKQEKKDQEKPKKKKVVKRQAVRLLPAQVKRSPYSEAKFRAAKKFLVARDLTAHVEFLERICKIDKKQKFKLSIAVKGHTAKFVETWFDDNEQYFRNLFARNQKKDEEQDVVYNSVDEIDANTLRMVTFSRKKIYTGELGPVDHPRWQKSVSQTLRGDQVVVYEKHRADKRSRMRQHQLSSAISMLENVMDLSNEQIDQIKKLVKPEFERFNRPTSNFIYSHYVSMYCLNEVERELDKILTSAQQDKWEVMINPYRATMNRIDQELAEEDQNQQNN